MFQIVFIHSYTGLGNRYYNSDILGPSLGLMALTHTCLSHSWDKEHRITPRLFILGLTRFTSISLPVQYSKTAQVQNKPCKDGNYLFPSPVPQVPQLQCHK